MTMSRPEDTTMSCTIDLNHEPKSLSVEYHYRKDSYKAVNVSLDKANGVFMDVEEQITRYMHGCCGLRLWSTGLLRNVIFTIREKSGDTYKEVFKLEKDGIKETVALSTFREVELQYYRIASCSQSECVYTRGNVK